MQAITSMNSKQFKSRLGAQKSKPLRLSCSSSMTIHPDYALEGQKTLNENRKPSKYKAGSHQKIYWECQCCGFGANGEWYQEIKGRLKAKIHCEYCRKNFKNGISEN